MKQNPTDSEHKLTFDELALGTLRKIPNWYIEWPSTTIPGFQH